MVNNNIFFRTFLTFDRAVVYLIKDTLNQIS